MSYDFSITLYRDSLLTPWGFRLEGGFDYQSPLTIQRVFTGSPASTDLQRGDIILAIQNRDATYLLHKEADDLIRSSGGSILLTIRRPGGYVSGGSVSYRQVLAHSPLHYRSAITNYNNDFAHLFNNEDPLSSYVRSRPIEKVRDPKPILSQTGSPMMPGDLPNFSSPHAVKRYRPTSTLPLFANSNRLPQTNFSIQPHQQQQQQHHQQQQQTHLTTNIFNTNTNLTATPYDKRMASQIHQSLNRAAHRNIAYAPVYLPIAAPPPRSPKPVYHDDFNHQYSSSFGGPSHGTTTVHALANAAQSQQLPKSPLPKVKNLQYNSPIGLYSRANIQEELNKQVGVSHQFEPASEF